MNQLLLLPLLPLLVLTDCYENEKTGRPEDNGDPTAACHPAVVLSADLMWSRQRWVGGLLVGVVSFWGRGFFFAVFFFFFMFFCCFLMFFGCFLMLLGLFGAFVMARNMCRPDFAFLKFLLLVIPYAKQRNQRATSSTGGFPYGKA